MLRTRVVLPVGAALVSALTACGASAEPPDGTPARPTTPVRPSTRDGAPKAAAVAAPGAVGPPVPIVWRTGREVRGSGLDGGGDRRLLHLRSAGRVAATPAPDGTRVAFMDGDRLRVLQVADGGIRDIGTIRGATPVLRWSPDGTRVAAPADVGLTVCDVGPGAVGCRRWSGRLAAGTGATWSPDGRSVAVVRFPEPSGGAPEHQVLTVTDGRTSRTVERFRSSAGGTRLPQVSPPVWTRAGLGWSVLDLRLEGGELAGITRARVRLRSGNRSRTLASGPLTGSTFEPFRFAGEAADGTLLGVRTRMRRTASTFDLRSLTPGGTSRSAGVALGAFDPEMGNPSAEVLGTLSDGRVAVAVRGEETARFRLHLAVLGRSAGPMIRRADEVAVATTHPGNPVEE